MFQKLVAIEPVSLVPSAEKALYSFAGQVVMYPDIPANDDEIIPVSEMLMRCFWVIPPVSTGMYSSVVRMWNTLECVAHSILPKVPMSIFAMLMNGVSRWQYPGLWWRGSSGICSQWVGALFARLWTGIVGAVASWDYRIESRNVGLGKSGGMIADALKFFGAEISYYARSEKEAATAKGYCFLPLEKLLAESEVICCCLNKNTVCCMKRNSGRWVIGKSYSIPVCRRHGMRLLLLNGWKVITFAFVTR